MSVAQLALHGCEDSVVHVPLTVNNITSTVPAARIVTRIPNFDVGSQRSLGDVKAALHPTNWPVCLHTFWCDMITVPLPVGAAAGPKFYCREVVGDCPTTWFEPYLVFATSDLPNPQNPSGFMIEYALAAPADLVMLGGNQPLHQDAHVEVDSGAIIVMKSSSWSGTHHAVDITTSKTIRFQDPLPTGGVAMLACVSGWADQTRGMISGCLGPGT